jgi:hypothetical protein
MVATSVFEAATLHQSVCPVCQCGHSARFEAHGLWWHFQRHGWDDRLSAARLRFWCRVCRSRIRRKIKPARLETLPSQASDFELPMPDECEWKRAVARIR